MSGYFINTWKTFAANFRLDRRFLYSVLLDIAFVVLFIIGMLLLQAGMGGLIPDTYPLQSKLDSMDYMQRLELTELKDTLVDAQNRMLMYSFLFILYLTLICTGTRCMIYSLIERKDLFPQGWLKKYLKFVVLNIVLFLILFVIYLAVMGLLSLLLGPAVSHGKGVQLLVFLFIAYFVCLLHYMLVTTSFIYIHSSRLWRSVGMLFTTIMRNIHLALLPALLVLLMFILLNIIIIFLSLAGPLVSMLLVTILMLFFISFLRFYYNRVLNTFAVKAAPVRTAPKKPAKPAGKRPAKARKLPKKKAAKKK
jgi:hypothetical protein